MIYKFVNHIHSTWSYDGKYSLEELRTIFKKYNFDGMFTTEHDKGFSRDKWNNYIDICEKLSDENFKIVPGMEYSDPENIIHVQTWGEHEFAGELLPTHEMLEKIKDQNVFIVWGHPELKNGVNTFDFDLINKIDAIEIWNRKADGIKPSKISSKIAEDNGLIKIAALDFHSKKQLFPLYLKIDIKKPLKKNNLIDSLKNDNIEPQFGWFKATAFCYTPLFQITCIFDLIRKIILRKIRK